MKGIPMYYVRQIMELLNLDEEMARKVFAWMDLDCSECTQAEFDESDFDLKPWHSSPNTASNCSNHFLGNL